MRKYLRQRLIRVFHYDIEQGNITEIAASCLEKTKQVRMNQFRRRFPSGKLDFAVCLVCHNQLDRGFLWLGPASFCNEYGVKFRASQVLA